MNERRDTNYIISIRIIFQSKIMPDSDSDSDSGIR